LLFHVQTAPFVRNTRAQRKEKEEESGKAASILQQHRLLLYLAPHNVVFEDTVQLLRILLQFGHTLKHSANENAGMLVLQLY
jgi:hypothetical protein